MAGKLQVIVGGQFGSEGKGAITAYLAKTEERNVTAVRVAGPNAGHTAYDSDGEKYALRSLPVASIARPDAYLVIAAGSEIDYSVLDSEIQLTMKHKSASRLVVDEQATVIEKSHVEMEQSIGTGSTHKGIGAARAERLMRRATVAGETNADYGYMSANTADFVRDRLRAGDCVQIEGTQGYGLGLHSGYYPYTTSSNCRAVDFMAMAGISPWSDVVEDLEIWIVYRTYPIRIAGNSGPMYSETSWEALNEISNGHINPEFTTVTQKRRRVGQWDYDLARAALIGNGGPSPQVHVALTFLDYVNPNVADLNRLDPDGMASLDTYEELLAHDIDLVGTGPNSIADLR